VLVLGLGIAWYSAITPAMDKAFAPYDGDAIRSDPLPADEELFVYRLRVDVSTNPEMWQAYKTKLGLPTCPEVEAFTHRSDWASVEWAQAYRRCQPMVDWVAQHKGGIFWTDILKADPGLAIRRFLITSSLAIGGEVYAHVPQVVPAPIEKIAFPEPAVRSPARPARLRRRAGPGAGGGRPSLPDPAHHQRRADGRGVAQHRGHGGRALRRVRPVRGAGDAGHPGRHDHSVGVRAGRLDLAAAYPRHRAVVTGGGGRRPPAESRLTCVCSGLAAVYMCLTIGGTPHLCDRFGPVSAKRSPRPISLDATMNAPRGIAHAGGGTYRQVTESTDRQVMESTDRQGGTR
jgi:hypothetical protein